MLRPISPEQVKRVKMFWTLVHAVLGRMKLITSPKYKIMTPNRGKMLLVVRNAVIHNIGMSNDKTLMENAMGTWDARNRTRSCQAVFFDGFA
jgi:hypothetical protein